VAAALAALREDVRQAVTPLASVEKKRTPQSTHPKAVAAALAETQTWLTDLKVRPRT